MPNLGDLFNQLKSTVVGTKTAKIDIQLDKAVKDIVSYKSHSGRSGYIDLVKSVISKTTANVSFNQNNLYSQSQVGPAAMGQGARLMRYKAYQAIITNINYAYRALTVLTDNILSPDDITKVSLDVKPKEFLDEGTPSQSQIKRVKLVIKELKLEKRLTDIVRTTLGMGDYFCEIAPAKVALTSKSILNESNAYLKERATDIKNGYVQEWSENVKIEGKQKTIEFSIDYSLYEKESSDPPTSEQEKNKLLKNLNLVFHRPNLVVKLQSSLYPICFGYLIFPEVKGLNTPGNAMEDDAVNNICISILKKLEAKLPQMKEFQDNKELFDIIKYMVIQSDPAKIVQMRYVPPDRMVHFMVPTTKFYPYGESIFDASQFTAKLLISLQTALAIQRLSRSTEKRKVAVEVGLPRDAQKVIEEMKESFRKRKISLDNFGTVDTIPSMITTFEDVYIPQKDGKSFVDISTFNEGSVDVRSKVDELKFLRDELTATWGVPPSFLGIEENLSNKAALSEENILFARTVITHQKYLSDQVTELIDKIFNIIDPEEALTILDSCDVHFPTPKSLQYEREARYLNELVSLVENLDRIGIPKEYSKKKYLSNFDWDEIKKYDIDEKVEQTIDPSKKDEDQFGGGMGGMGGSF